MFTFDFVDENPVRLDQWYDLRRDLYLHAGLIKQSDLDVENRYIDEYDAASTHLMMRDQIGDSVGSCRVIDGRRSPLQVSKTFGVLNSIDAIEVSGFAVTTRRRVSLVTLGCYWLVYDYARSNGYDEIHFEIEPWLQRTLLRIGFPIEQTGEPMYVYNAVNAPFRVRVADLVPALIAKDSTRSGAPLGTLFARPFPGYFDPAELINRPTLPAQPAA